MDTVDLVGSLFKLAEVVSRVRGAAATASCAVPLGFHEALALARLDAGCTIFAFPFCGFGGDMMSY